MTKRKPKRLREVVYAKVGFRKSVLVLRFIWLWWVYTEAKGEQPRSLTAFADSCEVDHATAYRWSALLREVFPDAETPQWVIDRLELPTRPRKFTQADFGSFGVAL